MKTNAFLLAIVGASLSLAACSDPSATGTGSDDVTGDASSSREVYACNLNDGARIEATPAFAELKQIDANGEWSIRDGLSFETSPFVIQIADDEGNVFATIDKHMSYAADNGATIGTCKKLAVTELKPTSELVTLEDGLEYACVLQDGTSLVVRPSFSEVDEFSAEGKFYSHDAISFSVSSLESLPPKSQIRGVDDEGAAFATLTEDDRGVSITKGTVQGSCTKQRRAIWSE